jgi:hypothetical protein
MAANCSIVVALGIAINKCATLSESDGERAAVVMARVCVEGLTKSYSFFTLQRPLWIRKEAPVL